MHAKTYCVSACVHTHTHRDKCFSDYRPMDGYREMHASSKARTRICAYASMHAHERTNANKGTSVAQNMPK